MKTAKENSKMAMPNTCSAAWLFLELLLLQIPLLRATAALWPAQHVHHNSLAAISDGLCAPSQRPKPSASLYPAGPLGW